jgi:cellulose synthase/poly-beta-1,6-N-acetylglucosamine synthase-like glycosyltransferase
MTVSSGLVMVVLVAGIAVVQAGVALAFVRIMRKPRATNPEAALPRAAVVLSVRGPDPCLEANMAALLDQDYPDFRLFIVVDSDHDAAWPHVKRVQALASDRVETRVLQNPLPTCSLKCSSLAEVVERLDDSYDVVAFLDGDAPPHRTWLRELVEPLSSPSVGVTTGNRWYLPQRGNWGSLVRYFWNAGAVVQVWMNGITWAGSMAMRRDVIREIGLVRAWRRALSVDATVVRKMREHGYRTEFVPSVIMPNREAISLSKFMPWAERQMIAAKSSGSGWALMATHVLSIAGCMFAPFAWLLAGIATRNTYHIGVALAAIAAYWGGVGLSTLVIERAMQKVFQRNGVASSWLAPDTGLRLAPAFLLSHLVCLQMLIGVCWRNRVSWRGVEYEIRGNDEVRLLAYRPYVAVSGHALMESVA